MAATATGLQRVISFTGDKFADPSSSVIEGVYEDYEKGLRDFEFGLVDIQGRGNAQQTVTIAIEFKEGVYVATFKNENTKLTNFHNGASITQCISEKLGAYRIKKQSAPVNEGNAPKMRRDESFHSIDLPSKKPNKQTERCVIL